MLLLLSLSLILLILFFIIYNNNIYKDNQNNLKSPDEIEKISVSVGIPNLFVSKELSGNEGKGFYRQDGTPLSGPTVTYRGNDFIPYLQVFKSGDIGFVRLNNIGEIDFVDLLYIQNNLNKDDKTKILNTDNIKNCIDKKSCVIRSMRESDSLYKTSDSVNNIVRVLFKSL
jgi:hypothetical protein